MARGPISDAPVVKTTPAAVALVPHGRRRGRVPGRNLGCDQIAIGTTHEVTLPTARSGEAGSSSPSTRVGHGHPVENAVHPGSVHRTARSSALKLQGIARRLSRGSDLPNVATKEERLIEAIRQLASFSVVDNVMPEILHRVALLATDTVDGADFVGLMMAVDGRLQTPVFTDEEAPEIDSAQYETGIGPCLDSYRDRAIYTIPSTPKDTRWPPFSGTCQAYGVLSTCQCQ